MSALDTKPYVEPHPLLGYRYVPNTRLTLPRPGGGHYEIAINSQGIRSDRDYSFQKPAGTKRIIVLGDSMAAGQFVSNGQRFSELLERRVSNLEIINLALEGSGTDQQLLLYEQARDTFEHDAVIILPFLQNIRRNLASAREAIDPATGATVLRPKPRFELKNGELVLHAPDAGTAAAGRDSTDAAVTPLGGVKTAINKLPGSAAIKRALYAVMPWEPFPEYRSPHSAAWRLMEAILLRLKERAAPRPLVIAPTFYSNYLHYRMATNYLERFRSLSDEPRVHVIDLLPKFKAIGADAVRCFQEPFDMHFSSFGHLALADALEAELTSRRLLP